VSVGEITRDLSADENYSGGPLAAGTLVYKFFGCTYGCIAPGGIAVSLVPDQIPFFELPEDAVSWRQSWAFFGNRETARK
jgi:hypothetical protein